MRVWIRKGVPLSTLLSPAEGADPFPFAALYPAGVAPAPSLVSGGVPSADGTRDGGDVPPLSLWRLQNGSPSAPSVAASAPRPFHAALADPSLPSAPSEPAEVYGDYCLFAIAHTLALCQAALELQHHELGLSNIALLPASEVLVDGVPLDSLPELTYEWGGYTYAFRTPALVPTITCVHAASARLDGVIVDVPPPTLLPPLSATSDLHDFWKRARGQIRCGELVRRRLHGLLMQGVAFDAQTTDPWEQYRVRTQYTPATPPLAALPFRWLPEPLAGRDASNGLLTRLKSTALLRLRDRAQQEEATASVSESMSGGNGPASPNVKHASPTRRSSVHRSSIAGHAGSKATADVLQELYLKARIREAEEARQRDEEQKAEAALRARLSALPPERVKSAVANGWDGLQELLGEAVGNGAWMRAVNALPDEWEEEEALEALADLLQRPNHSSHMWLLLARD